MNTIPFPLKPIDATGDYIGRLCITSQQDGPRGIDPPMLAAIVAIGGSNDPLDQRVYVKIRHLHKGGWWTQEGDVDEYLLNDVRIVNWDEAAQYVTEWVLKASAFEECKRMADEFKETNALSSHMLGHCTLEDYNFFTDIIEGELYDLFHSDGTLTDEGRKLADEHFYSDNTALGVFYLLRHLLDVATQNHWHSADDLSTF